REPLMPVEGADGVLFPSTFAASKEQGFPGGYNINTFGDETGGGNVCLIDSVGSQANRIEPLFMRDKYKHLVPQIVITAGEKEVSILEAGHRAGDALLRCSSLQDELQKAFRAELIGDCEPLAKIAPTSLVFGVWDSRDTQSKRPRLVGSSIRAFNVRKLTRGAVYIPPLDYAELDVFSEEDKAKAEGNNKSPLAQRGFVHNPASSGHGGVIADGGIRRDATLGLAALRHLHAGKDAEKTLVLRRYILGLSLVAFTAPTESYLRQGCTLVLNPDQPREFVEVYPDGQRKPCDITHEAALAFATEAAKAFGVGQSRTVPFEKERAKRDVSTDEAGKGKSKGKRGKKADASTDEPETNG
ncbi:MAG: type I-U CRISPR-associated protein Cas7, partial [Rhodopirellula sp.]|nr:type I-U CRISPR-associated protein Cas7 [Rhodopirellula sp.]